MFGASMIVVRGCESCVSVMDCHARSGLYHVRLCVRSPLCTCLDRPPFTLAWACLLIVYYTMFVLWFARIRVSVSALSRYLQLWYLSRWLDCGLIPTVTVLSTILSSVEKSAVARFILADNCSVWNRG